MESSSKASQAADSSKTSSSHQRLGGYSDVILSLPCFIKPANFVSSTSQKTGTTYDVGEDIGPFTCLFCDKKFFNSHALGAHLNAHKKERRVERKTTATNLNLLPKQPPLCIAPHACKSSLTTKSVPTDVPERPESGRGALFNTQNFVTDIDGEGTYSKEVSMGIEKQQRNLNEPPMPTANPMEGTSMTKAEPPRFDFDLNIAYSPSSSDGEEPVKLDLNLSL